MGYSNSSLVAYTMLSPNHSGQRTMKIDRITPHCVVGQCSAEGLGGWFYKSSTQASSNYGIDKDGRVGMYVEEKTAPGVLPVVPMTRGQLQLSALLIPQSLIQCMRWSMTD